LIRKWLHCNPHFQQQLPWRVAAAPWSSRKLHCYLVLVAFHAFKTCKAGTLASLV
jgi:hypothetical protein